MRVFGRMSVQFVKYKFYLPIPLNVSNLIPLGDNECYFGGGVTSPSSKKSKRRDMEEDVYYEVFELIEKISEILKIIADIAEELPREAE